MKDHHFDYQNYRVFKVEQAAESLFLHFFWGKFDFRLSLKKTEANFAQANAHFSFRAENEYWTVAQYQTLHHDEWYDFVKPTAHGLSLEESQWKLGKKVYYGEFPQDLKMIACQIIAEECNIQWLHPAPPF